MKFFIYGFLSFYFLINSLYAQTSIDWNILADVHFEEKKDETADLTFNQATFGPMVSQFKDQEVSITGYMIPMDPMGLSFALSKNPNAVCFFCGGAGPETVVQLKFTTMKRYATDARLTFKGMLQLNEQDINSLTYVLKEATEF